MSGTIQRLANVRTLLGLAMVFGVVSSQAGRGTLAFFTDTATSNTNTFTTGSIDIELATNGTDTADCDSGLTYSDATSAMLTVSARQPGDVATRALCIFNESSTLATRWSLSSTVSDDTTGATLLETEMKIRIWTLNAANSIAATPCGPGFTNAATGTSTGTGEDLTDDTGYAALLYGGANGLALNTNPSFAHSADTQIAASAYQKVCFSVVLPTTVSDSNPEAGGTSLQGKTVTANFTITGNQTTA